MKFYKNKSDVSSFKYRRKLTAKNSIFKESANIIFKNGHSFLTVSQKYE